MTRAIFRITGERVGSPSDVPTAVVATVFAPERSDDGLDFCRVSIPALFDDDKRIPGVDAEQAVELVIEFVRDIFDGFNVRMVSEIRAKSGQL